MQSFDLDTDTFIKGSVADRTRLASDSDENSEYQF
jgi:hypothetical protein